jgi:hypothetical protein
MVLDYRTGGPVENQLEQSPRDNPRFQVLLRRLNPAE